MQSALRPSRFIRSDRLSVSFEFFPPKDEAMEKILWESIERLTPLAPNFVSVTYGAGGSTRERTHNTVKRILNETSLTPAAHLTCVAATREEIDEIVRGYYDAGVRHIVALRGDSVDGPGTRYQPHPGGYQNGADLTAGIKRIAHDFEVSVSAYPERHPDSPTLEADIDMLKAKVDSGATRAITQFFFDNELYFRYLDRVQARGIDVPIVPGIMPITSVASIRRMTSLGGGSLPDELDRELSKTEDDDAATLETGVAWATEQCRELLERGVPGIHFYTLNRSPSTRRIFESLFS